MRKIRNTLLLSALILGSTTLSACGSHIETEETLTVTYDEGKRTVTRGEKYDLNYAVKEDSLIKSNHVKFSIISGKATINEDGLLSVAKDAVVGSEIIVRATANIKINGKDKLIESDLVKFTVADLVPNKIVLAASPSVITRDTDISFSVSYEPDYATLKDYTLSLEDTCDYALITSDNKVTLKNNIDYKAINGKKFKVTATLNDDKTKTSTVEISVNTELEVAEISCETISIIAKKDGSKTIVTEGFDDKGRTIDLSPNVLKYEVKDEYKNILSVDTNGLITPKGHGKAIVNVSYGKDDKLVKTDCVVYVMVAPEQIKLETNNTYILGNKTIDIAIDDEFYNLPFKAFDGDNYIGSKDLTVKFDMTENGKKVPQEEIGEYQEGKGFRFKKTGTVKAIISSSSSLNDVVVDPSYEVEEVITFRVNDGFNIRNIDDYYNYGNDENKNKTANVLENVIIDENNYRKHYNGTRYESIFYQGDTRFEGNGYSLEAGKFTKDRYKAESVDLISFIYDLKNPKDFNVTINNWKLRGTLRTEDIKCSAENEPKDTVLPFRWGLTVTGNASSDYEAKRSPNKAREGIVANVSNLNINNVEVSGFQYSSRFGIVNESNIVNYNAHTSAVNNIDNEQSHLNFTNLTSSCAGMFVMEVVDDLLDYRNAKPEDVKGKAGVNHNQPSSFSFNGTINIDNWNTGEETVGMRGPVIQGNPDTMPQLIVNLYQAASLRLLKKFEGNENLDTNSKETLDKLEILNDLFKSSVRGMHDGALRYNFFTLIFMDPSDYPATYNDGNIHENIARFNTNKAIRFDDLAEYYYKDQNYDYSDIQFIIFDLIFPADLLGGANVGQAVFFNTNYGIKKENQ